MNTDGQEQLEAENERLQALVAEQAAALDAQAALIEQLRSEVAELKARLGLDSSNSSLPPSRDHTDRRARRAAERAQRKAATKDGNARKPGKQPGAPGSTLYRRPPDREVVHRPSTCGGCGASLAEAPVVGSATRQVLEVPTPQLEAIDHIAERRRCACGCETVAVFPPEATGPVCWGPRVKAAAAYLLARQHLPLERGAEAMAVLFDAPMGEGTLAGLLPDAASRLDAPGGFMDRLRSLLHACPFAHADETSIRVCITLGWVHTVSTPGLTLLAYHARRGIDAMVEIGVLTDYVGTIVHDGLASYDREELAGATHAQCCAHLLRHLDAVDDATPGRGWTRDMRRVLLDARDASEQAAAAGLAAVPAAIADPIRARYRTALNHAFASLPPGPPPRRRHTGGWSHAEREAWNLAARMKRHEEQVLRLLDDTRVPFTNNEGERSLRMAKLHDKISGHFRSESNAKAFLTVRSYLQTGAKHGHNALQLLTDLWTTKGAWLPSVAVPGTG